MQALKSHVHALKGSSSYMSASHLHYVCFWMELHFEFGRIDKMVDYYPTLVESAIEFRIVSRKLANSHKGKWNNISAYQFFMVFFLLNSQLYFRFHAEKEVHKIDESLETVPLAKTYRLEKHKRRNVVYCLKAGQSVSQRIKERKKYPMVPQ